MQIREITEQNYPEEVFPLLQRIEEAGFEAWIVGGAVRDSLLGRPVHDIDIASSAQPDQIQKIFSDRKTLDVGKSFGTIRVLWGKGVYEVTTYRAERGYSDGRHPDLVSYSNQIEEDLKRRDFTINAMAWHPDRGLLDLYGGREDLEKEKLRAVGEADARIQEDGLRMLRAIRFAARFNLQIEGSLSQAIHRYRLLLNKISRERCYEEMERMLMGERAGRAMQDLVDYGLMDLLIPSLLSAEANEEFPGPRMDPALLEALPQEIHLRWSALLLPLGAEQGRGARKVLRALKASNERQRQVAQIAGYSWQVIQGQRSLPDRLSQVQILMGSLERSTESALLLSQAWLHAHRREKEEQARRALRLYHQALEENLPWRIQDLAIDGHDLRKLGMDEGRQIGQTLETLLQKVIMGELTNERVALEQAAEELSSLNSF